MLLTNTTTTRAIKRARTAPNKQLRRRAYHYQDPIACARAYHYQGIPQHQVLHSNGSEKSKSQVRQVEFRLVGNSLTLVREGFFHLGFHSSYTNCCGKKTLYIRLLFFFFYPVRLISYLPPNDSRALV